METARKGPEPAHRAGAGVGLAGQGLLRCAVKSDLWFNPVNERVNRQRPCRPVPEQLWGEASGRGVAPPRDLRAPSQSPQSRGAAVGRQCWKQMAVLLEVGGRSAESWEQTLLGWEGRAGWRASGGPRASVGGPWRPFSWVPSSPGLITCHTPAL